MIATAQSSNDSTAGELTNLDPPRLAKMALGSAAARRWALSSLRYVVRHHRQSGRLVELTGAHICLMGGANELRRVAETAEADDTDNDGQVLRLLLLSGFWRTEEVRHTLA